MNILIIRLGAIGDVLRTTALLPGLKAKYPDCRVFWVTKENALEILKHNPLVDKLFVFDKASVKKLEEETFDLIISLDGDKEASRLASDLKSSRIFGSFIKDDEVTYSDDSSALFDMLPISRRGSEEAAMLRKQNRQSYQDILYDSLALDKSLNRLELCLNDRQKEFAKLFMEKNGLKKEDFIVGVNTGAALRWSQKKLGIEKSVELIDVLLERKYKVVLLGGPDEKDRNCTIMEHFGAEIIDSGTDNSLLDFAAIISVPDVIVTSDTLAMHLAIALAKRVIAFFGPTSSSEIEMYGSGKKIIADMGCISCYKKSCDLVPDCMSQIDIGGIVDAIEEFRASA